MPTGSRREEQEETDKDRKRIVVHGGVWGLLGTESRENWVKTVVPGDRRGATRWVGRIQEQCDKGRWKGAEG